MYTKEKKNKYNIEYNKNHKEERRIGNKRYREKNKEKIAARRQKRVVKRKTELAKYKGGVCQGCGLAYTEENYFVFDFHHMPEFTKQMGLNIGSLANMTRKVFEVLAYQEVAKCMLLCSNCHRTIHFHKR